MDPIELRPDNFTPTARTPWGGTRISLRYKGMSVATVIGESWELSVEPDFPSITRDGARLSERLDAEALGREAHRGGTALLVKLLDAADELSVQIHPSDDYAGLGPDESGKPECWYVAARDEGAGVYLGLREGVTEASMRETLAANGEVSELLYFVPVEVGDFLLIEAGTAHAIGRGLTLVEPQRVVPGRRGVTYRYWDWNRRYDARGVLDPRGSPRALHVEHALAVTRWDEPREEAFLARARLRAGVPGLDGPARVTPLCGQSEGLASDALQVARLEGTGTTPLPRWNALIGLTVLEGAVRVAAVTARAGETLALPASVGEAALHCDRAHALLSATY